MTAHTELKKLYDAGAHMGHSRTRRHPTASPFIFSTKDRTDVFDLEQTQKRFATAIEFLQELSRTGKTAVFVGGKHEAMRIVKEAAVRIGAPYVAGRWIGGTLTNFKIIRKRIDRLERLMKERESGELEKYTKRERLMLDREIDELTNRFGGIVSLRDIPGALVVIDTRFEHIAVKEANQLGIPVVGLASTDCDFSQIQFPVPANDTSVKSIQYVVEALADAYQEGKRPQAK